MTKETPLISGQYYHIYNRGNNGKAIVCATMRKLIHLAFGILKLGDVFDPNYAS